MGESETERIEKKDSERGGREGEERGREGGERRVGCVKGISMPQTGS